MKNFNCLILSICLILVSISCNNQPRQTDTDQVKGEESSTIKSKKISRENAQWAYDYNLKVSSFSSLYAPDAVKILTDGEVINGAEKIGVYILVQSPKISTIRSDISVLANERRAIEYEILEITYDNQKKQKSLVIWQTNNAEKKRVFEFTTIMTSPEKVLTEIDQRRDLWIKLCNQHDAAKLIEELYSENTIYYNHKPIITGRESLVKEYQYMNNPQYQLSLKPTIVKPVNEDFIFEIGQCSGSYGGKYILIWRKDPDGEWRIFIDSNI
jgi:ketosteroid isomerase-like protein